MAGWLRLMKVLFTFAWTLGHHGQPWTSLQLWHTGCHWKTVRCIRSFWILCSKCLISLSWLVYLLDLFYHVIRLSQHHTGRNLAKEVARILCSYGLHDKVHVTVTLRLHIWRLSGLSGLVWLVTMHLIITPWQTSSLLWCQIGVAKIGRASCRERVYLAV